MNPDAMGWEDAHGDDCRSQLHLCCVVNRGMECCEGHELDGGMGVREGKVRGGGHAVSQEVGDRR